MKVSISDKHTLNGYTDFFIDAADLEQLKTHTIYINTHYPGTSTERKDVYIYHKIDKKTYRVGRYILNPPKDLEVDHINHNPLDNRRCNLRVITRAENAKNRKKKPLY